jgi:hypothetical protein
MMTPITIPAAPAIISHIIDLLAILHSSAVSSCSDSCA